jgi:hypothetical protein
MTEKMLAALELLFRSEENANWLTLSTAFALERKGLVWMPKNPRQRTEGRYFPEYWATLTDEGKAYCTKHYRKIGAHATA